ncbi:hypothetical protein [Mycobacterium hubeiense]|uniref:hypothetical protein n=1 Tax=Mycobacterium hubeiense TaxID=1867256 RepID=UPI0018EC249F|nr:hypothetical protein [Mycobacterium sp. QGD 101]
MTAADVAVVLFGERRLPRPLRALPTANLDEVQRYRRVVVVGADADLAAVLKRLLRADRLDVEVAHVTSWRRARRAICGAAQRVPLIRDETGTVIVGSALWRGVDGPLHGEAIVDDTVLFDGDVAAVRVEPTFAMPGLRATVVGRGGRRWVAGRAAQLGTTGAVVVRDGVAAPRPVKRSTFYRHTEGWLRVR